MTVDGGPEVAVAGPARLNSDDASRVMAALYKLEEPDRRLVERKLFEGETFAGIASDVGESANTLKTRYYRALDRLESSLRSIFGETDG